MSDYRPEPDSPSMDVPAPAQSPTEAHPPLLGCLYCHTEGTITFNEGRKILGLGSGLPTLTCKNCGSVAVFDASARNGAWRIRYRRVNREPLHYYAMVYLGGAGWLDADEAMEISRRAFVQRRRIQQVEAGYLNWLNPAPLDPPPPLMSPDEMVYVTIAPVTFQQTSRGGAVLSQEEENVLDSGHFFLTDKKVHLLGQRRDWSHKLQDIREVTYTDRYWRIYVGASNQYYQGVNQPDQLDAQLCAAIVRTLMK